MPTSIYFNDIFQVREEQRQLHVSLSQLRIARVETSQLELETRAATEGSTLLRRVGGDLADSSQTPVRNRFNRRVNPPPTVLDRAQDKSLLRLGASAD